MRTRSAMYWMFLALTACGDDGGSSSSLPDASGPIEPPNPACPASETGSEQVAAPVLRATLADRFHEGWLASPGVADLEDDGSAEIVLARAARLSVWHEDESLVWDVNVDGRIWSSPVIAELLPDSPGLEVAIATRGEIHLYDAQGNLASGYPFVWQNEMRSLAAGDIDGDGQLELAAVTTNPLSEGGQRDIVIAIEADGATVVDGFPPNTTGASGCDDTCFVTGGFDQNIALGDVNGDGAADVFATQDNAYMSLHEGDGTAFAAASIFEGRSYFSGIRFLHDYAEAQQGFADDEATANQAHFTNSAPAIADIDGDGSTELVVLGSVQNAAQSDRERGVGLWVVKPDGTRLAGWEEPFHAEGYLAGLVDFEATNVVAATNQVSVANIDPERDGLEMVFAGFDGRIHAVDASRSEMWSYAYTEDERVLTAGVAIADLSGDGRPEIIFASYSPDEDKSHLFILGAGGAELHKIALPNRGAMSVPTLADTDGDGELEIVLAMKAGADGLPQGLIYEVEGATDGCNLWSTGRGNALRNGFVAPVAE